MSPKVRSEGGLRLDGPRFSTSLEMGALIIASFTSRESLRGVAEIAEELQASRSTVHRYLSTLVALGMLDRDPESRRYKLGAVPMNLGRAALERERAVNALGGELAGLRRKTGCVVRAGVLVDLEVLIIGCERSFMEGQGLLGVQLRRGGRIPAHCTALGKMLLGGLEPDKLGGLLSEAKLGSLTAKTLTGESALVAAVSKARERGYAIEAKEHEEEVLGIAVPVLDKDGVSAAALSLVGCEPQVSVKTLEGHLDALLASAQRIGGRMARAPVTRRPRRRD